MERERLTRYSQAVAKWKNECNLIDRIGVLCGDKPWDVADEKAKSMIYLTIVIEGRRMYTRRYPHTNVENITTLQLWEELELTFIRPRNVTFDRYLLLTRRQQKRETMEQFHSALRSLAEFCQLGALEDDLLRDIFTANMTDPEIQKELLKVTLEPEKALELAISIELGARSQLAIQAKHTSDPSMVSIVGRSEPVLAISSSRYQAQDVMEISEAITASPETHSHSLEATSTITTSQTDNMYNPTAETADNTGHKIIEPNAKHTDKYAEDAISPTT